MENVHGGKQRRLWFAVINGNVFDERSNKRRQSEVFPVGLISAVSYANVSWSTKTRGWSWRITPHSQSTICPSTLRQHVVNKVNAEKSNKFKLRVTQEKACFCLKPTTFSSAAAPSWMCSFTPGLLFHYQLTMWWVCLTNDPLLSPSFMYKWLHTLIISSCCAV